MNTITLSVPKDIAEKYWKKIVDYKELLEYLETKLWIDTNVQPKIKMEDFYNIVKNSDGWKVAKNSK